MNMSPWAEETAATAQMDRKKSAKIVVLKANSELTCTTVYGTQSTAVCPDLYWRI